MASEAFATLPVRDLQPVLGIQPPVPANEPLRGLLISADRALVRAFHRELRDGADCAVSFDVHPSLEEARLTGPGPYHWVTVDLDGAIPPSEAVRLAREHWPDSRIAVVSFWWSEREQLARQQADVVIHKPLRTPEIQAFLRSPARARRDPPDAEPDERVAAAGTG